MHRQGFSLIEVILATAILLGSVVVLSELAGIGRRQANRAERHTEAQQLCELTLHEMLLGLRPLEAVERAPLMPITIEGAERRQYDLFGEIDSLAAPIDAAGLDADAESAWSYSVRWDAIEEWPGLAALTVDVELSDNERDRPTRFSLTRWIDSPDGQGAQPAGSLDALQTGGFFEQGTAP